MNDKHREQYIENIDITYSYQLAKKMEEIRSNPILGYRTAGSKAEFDTGELLYHEMSKIGLTQVHKDEITVDAWEFFRASLQYLNEKEQKVEVQLGAYQTTLDTKGTKEYTIVYAGKGTEKDYIDLDVQGKLVLVDINQRDEWWISYPVYQAHRKGAVAVIAVQTGGYGEVDEASLNAQDIAGPKEAPAFSIDRKSAEELKRALRDKKELKVYLDAKTIVRENQKTYNIVGMIPGRNKERMILLSAHYDSYFDGFQDDNTAITMMLNIARTLLQIGYRPENTFIFCAMAAEEWGVIDSPFDWSTGAYEEVFHAHPEWRGKVIADLNFELPAYAHGTRARIRSCYEYVNFLKDFLRELPELTPAYPEETQVTAPIETWSDDFSIAIAGIPSMVNDFTGGSFMVTNYHSQFDDDSSYDKDVYQMHHELFGLLLMKIDETRIVPLDFSLVFQKMAQYIDLKWCKEVGIDGQMILKHLESAREEAVRVYEAVYKINQRNIIEIDSRGLCRSQLDDNPHENKDLTQSNLQDIEDTLLQVFQLEQDEFVRMDWYGNVKPAIVIYQSNLELMTGAIHDLKEKQLSLALRKLYQINNNCYAFMFEEKVYQHFTEYALKQSKERLKWGYGRIVGYEDLFLLVRSLLAKEETDNREFEKEIIFLQDVVKRQKDEYKKSLKSIDECTIKMTHMLNACIKEN